MNAVILGSNININDTQLIDCRKITEYLLTKGFNIYTDGRTGFSETANKFAFKNNFEKSFVIKLIDEEGNGYSNNNNIFDILDEIEENNLSPEAVIEMPANNLMFIAKK